MIKYQLVCEYAHEFEGWFQTGAAFDSQNQGGLVACPVCDSSKVRRALMTPNLASPKRRRSSPEMSVPSTQEARPGLSPHQGWNPAGDASPPVPAAVAAGVAEALSQLRVLQRKIRVGCRDVGHNFASEARKIHYGESLPENIYGQSTEEERDAMADEGIDVVAMPWLPPEH